MPELTQSLTDYIKKSFRTKREKEAFAIRCGTTLGYLRLVMCGARNCSATLAIAIDRESNGTVRCDVLCPEADFDYLRRQKLSA